MDRQLDLAALADLLGLSTRQARRLASQEGFPAARNGLWEAEEVWRWAAAADADLARRVPIGYQPPATDPAPHVGAREAAGLPRAVFVAWDARPGLVCFAYGLRDSLSAGQVVTQVPYPAEQVYAVCGVELHESAVDAPLPWLTIAYPHHPDPERGEEIAWRDLARLLGQPVPYWPWGLRQREHLLSWQPGDPVPVRPAECEVDLTAAAMLAVLEDDGPVRRTVEHLVRRNQWMATHEALRDTELIDTHADPAVMQVVARPLPTPEVDRDQVPEVDQRAAWLDLLTRRDDLAAAAVTLAKDTHGGRGFPFAAIERFQRRSATLDEWLAGLQPCDRLAGHVYLATREDVTDYLRDPRTDAPVVHTADGEVLTLVPYRLPTVEPLAELILDERPWVRTADGTLYLAPQGSYGGLLWGYSGSGPSTLAGIVDDLLTDITSPGREGPTGPIPPAGLLRLFRKKHPHGTVLSRTELEKAQAEQE